MKRRLPAKPLTHAKPGVEGKPVVEGKPATITEGKPETITEGKPDMIVAPEIVRNARQVLGIERPSAARCIVGGDQASVDATERLCWVCRRLKISAWRDADHQLPAQE